jgi:Metallo-peptidase family M12B Reprolysin-like
VLTLQSPQYLSRFVAPTALLTLPMPKFFKASCWPLALLCSLFLAGYAAAGRLPAVADLSTPQQAAEPVFDLQHPDVALLTGASPGDLITVDLAAGGRLTLRTDRLLPGLDGAVTWLARSVSPEVTATAIITVHEGHVDGVVNLANNRFTVVSAAPSVERSATGEVVKHLPRLTRVVDQAAAGMTRALSLRNDALVLPSTARKIIAEKQAAVTEAAETSEQAKILPTPQTTIDLMVLYTVGMTNVTRYPAGVMARLNQIVATANTAYINSEVAITLRLVRAEQVSYDESIDNESALYDLTPDTVNVSVPATLGKIANVLTLRNTYGADLVSLVRPFKHTTHLGCGIAWIGGASGGDIGNAFFNDSAYSIVSDGTSILSPNTYCQDATLTHELGHNMGLQHDRANANGVPYRLYGYGFIVGNDGDLMSYAPNNGLCFSSPNIRFNGSNCGVNQTTGNIMGIAADASPAITCNGNALCTDGARALNEARVKVSNYRATAFTNGITGTITLNGGGLSSVSFCTSDAAVTCTANQTTGAYVCNAPVGWSGSIHPRRAGARIPAQKFTNVNGTVVRNIAAQNDGDFPGCNLDVDRNGMYEPAIDGIAIARRMMRFGVNSMTGLSGVCAQNTTAASIYAAADPIYFNVTGGLKVQGTTDALIIIKAMQGLGNAEISKVGVEAGATNPTWLDSGITPRMRSWLSTTCGASFAF